MPAPVGAALLAAALVGSAFLAQGHLGLNLSDEGFLWYGTLRTAVGDVPLRDFQSYDPGRYYWGAAGSLLFGNGVVALRLSMAVFQAIGLWLGLLAARRIAPGAGSLAAIGFLLLVWVIPGHKTYDHAILLAWIYLGVRLVENQSPRTVFTSGAVIGLSAFFGRNHALYGSLGLLGLLALIRWKTPDKITLRLLLLWLGGIIAGLVPLICMMGFVPGFFAAYYESVAGIFQHGTNLSVPVPWPWKARTSTDGWALADQLVIGSFYVALLPFYFAAISRCIWFSQQQLRENALLASCAFVGLFYAHHAFARAGLGHFAQAVHPFTLGLLAATTLSRQPKRCSRLLLAILVGLALFSVGRRSPIYECLTATPPWQRHTVGREVMTVEPSVARLLNCVEQLEREKIGRHEQLLVAPYNTVLYPVLGRESPLYEIYFLFPATADEQIRSIRELAEKGVNWALLADPALDGRADRRFSFTHRLLWQHLMDNFQPVDAPCLDAGMQLRRRISR